MKISVIVSKEELTTCYKAIKLSFYYDVNNIALNNSNTKSY